MPVIDQPKDLEAFLKQIKQNPSSPPTRKRVLVVHPRFFKVSYAINPYMKDAQGALKQIDSSKALDQWKDLIKDFETSGLEVEVLDGQAQYPDMVFAANQSFPFWNSHNQSCEVILSNMSNQERRGEVSYFEEWFRSQNFKYGFNPSGIKKPLFLSPRYLLCSPHRTHSCHRKRSLYE